MMWNKRPLSALVKFILNQYFCNTEKIANLANEREVEEEKKEQRYKEKRRKEEAGGGKG